MKIQGFTRLFGPNTYSIKPLLGMFLDLEDYAERPSSTFPGFPERLAARLPGLIEHRCSPGRRGGFLERLAEGTYMGHICEHVALELSEAAGMGVHFGRTVSTESPTVYLVLVAYKTEGAMRLLLEGAVELVQAVIDDRPFAIEALVSQARELSCHEALGPSTECIVDAALERGIPVRRRKDSLVQLGWGVHRRFIQAALTSRTPHIAVEIASDKCLTKEILRESYIPVPIGRDVRSENELAPAFAAMTPPLVVKPVDGNQGKGVSLNVSSLEAARAAFHIAREYSSTVVLEEQFRGRDFRVLVIGDEMVAASERVPAHVIGDGRHTICELIEIANRDPRRGDGHDKPLTRISVDAAAALCLQRRGIHLDAIPSVDEQVMLRENANLSTGGEARDVTALVHPSVAAICVRATQAIGLDVAGIDLMTEDITRPLHASEGIIEINAAPGLRMHVYPSEGKPIQVGRAVIDSLFPAGANGRIPIVAVTGTNGKTTTARMIAHAISCMGKRVGLTTTDGIFVGGESLGEVDAAGPLSAAAVLANPTVEVAVCETARGGLVRRGLGFDWCDVAVVTNIRPDHIGQDGIRDLEDLIWIKSLIAERTRTGGTLVINADDPGAMAVLARERVQAHTKKVVLYSEHAENPAIRAHLAQAGYALFVREGYIVEAYDAVGRPLLRYRDLPITFGGILNYNISNAMAAFAAACSLGVPEEIIIESALTFGPDRNPGRGNIYAVRDGFVMLDYGHNADAFSAVGRLRQSAWVQRMIGIVAVPGDRADESIREAGRVAARVFDEILIREDDDLRGRSNGETARLLCQTIHEVRPELRCEFVPDGEVAALRIALQQMRAGDFVVVFYDVLEPLTLALATEGARPVTPSQLSANWHLAPELHATSAA